MREGNATKDIKTGPHGSWPTTTQRYTRLFFRGFKYQAYRSDHDGDHSCQRRP